MTGKALEDTRGEDTHGKVDPSIDPVEQICSKMARLLDGTSEHTIARLTALRDRVDDLMRQHRERQKELQAALDRYVYDCERTVEAEGMMSRACDQLVDELKPARVPPTLTTVRNRNAA